MEQKIHRPSKQYGRNFYNYDYIDFFNTKQKIKNYFAQSENKVRLTFRDILNLNKKLPFA